ncbi:uncharacterized protein BCR38DRAFT_130876 [Pseudomassariella vexata]|uniref:Uncharacterized protein n=1 Tax=Pseudomassariella vexata TaxID=1141098 RepID=A0A1Y2E9V8_9PEZI|nr:uncharacterized protein BCR38DRAFT_130876 [Pseudomassariella vexata]ORY68363.1 hypothetical protein BCR38DRAFT_130876 [Pseudomassariella vexata]
MWARCTVMFLGTSSRSHPVCQKATCGHGVVRISNRTIVHENICNVFVVPSSNMVLPETQSAWRLRCKYSSVLITGVTGSQGPAVLIRLKGKLAPCLTSLGLSSSSSCKNFLIPDLNLPGPLDEATAGNDYVFHAAFFLPFQIVLPKRHYAELIAQPRLCPRSSGERAQDRNYLGLHTRPKCISKALRAP